MGGIHLQFGIAPDEFLDHLTEAAYRVALRRGVKGPFTDVIASLTDALREVIRRDMVVSDTCGLYSVCEEALNLEPWSSEAEKVFLTEDLMA